MKVIVTKAFKGAADSDPMPREFKPGEELVGELAGVAVREGWAEEVADDAAAPKPKGGKGKAKA